MDILSHGLWAGVPFYKKKPGKMYWLAFLFGVLPDAIAFVPHFLFVMLGRESDPIVSGVLSEEAFNGATFILYNITHSFVAFTAVFLILLFILKKSFWLMWGWGFHILTDIPTHTYDFFPTPFLWPISTFKFDGFSWGQPWFIALNYASILVAYLIARRVWRKN